MLLAWRRPERKGRTDSRPARAGSGGCSPPRCCSSARALSTWSRSARPGALPSWLYLGALSSPIHRPRSFCEPTPPPRGKGTRRPTLRPRQRRRRTQRSPGLRAPNRPQRMRRSIACKVLSYSRSALSRKLGFRSAPGSENKVPASPKSTSSAASRSSSRRMRPCDSPSEAPSMS